MFCQHNTACRNGRRSGGKEDNCLNELYTVSVCALRRRKYINVLAAIIYKWQRHNTSQICQCKEELKHSFCTRREGRHTCGCCASHLVTMTRHGVTWRGHVTKTHHEAAIWRRSCGRVAALRSSRKACHHSVETTPFFLLGSISAEPKTQGKVKHLRKTSIADDDGQKEYNQRTSSSKVGFRSLMVALLDTRISVLFGSLQSSSKSLNLNVTATKTKHHGRLRNNNIQVHVLNPQQSNVSGK